MQAYILTSAASWNSEQPLLTYIVPAALESELHSGQLVAVPYGNRLVEGIVWNICLDDEMGIGGAMGDEGAIQGAIQGAINLAPTGDADDIVLKPIHSIVDSDPVLLPHQ